MDKVAGNRQRRTCTRMQRLHGRRWEPGTTSLQKQLSSMDKVSELSRLLISQPGMKLGLSSYTPHWWVEWGWSSGTPKELGSSMHSLGEFVVLSYLLDNFLLPVCFVFRWNSLPLPRVGSGSWIGKGSEMRNKKTEIIFFMVLVGMITHFILSNNFFVIHFLATILRFIRNVITGFLWFFPRKLEVGFFAKKEGEVKNIDAASLIGNTLPGLLSSLPSTGIPLFSSVSSPTCLRCYFGWDDWHCVLNRNSIPSYPLQMMKEFSLLWICRVLFIVVVRLSSRMIFHRLGSRLGYIYQRCSKGDDFFFLRYW